MSVADIVVVIVSAAAIAGLGWFFFAPRRARTAELAGGVQRVTVTVRGGYSPDVIRARQGVPLELVFDRQESRDCTSRVVFPDLAVSASLPACHRGWGWGTSGHLLACRCSVGQHRASCRPPQPVGQRDAARRCGGGGGRRTAGGDHRPDPPAGGGRGADRAGA